MATKIPKTGISVDDKFLQDFIAKGGQAKTPTGTPVNTSNVNSLLASANADAPTVPSTKPDAKPSKDVVSEEKKADAIRQKVAKQQEDAEKNASKEKKDELRQLREEERQAEIEKAQREAKQRAALGTIRDTVDNTLEPLARGADKIASLRTVGGIGSLLVILMIFIFTIVPVNANGDTRLKQLWYMLNARASVHGRKAIEPAVNAEQLSQQELQTFTNDLNQTISDAANAVGQIAQDQSNAFASELGTDFGMLFRSAI